MNAADTNPRCLRNVICQRQSRERWGYSYITAHGPYIRTFAPVIPELRRR